VVHHRSRARDDRHCSFLHQSFQLGIEFAGGTSLTVPAKAQGRTLTQGEVSDAVSKAIKSVDPNATVGAAQSVGRAPGCELHCPGVGTEAATGGAGQGGAGQ